MKIRILFLISIIAVLAPFIKAYGQPTDPFCHMEVVSGSPVIFNFTTADDYANGKVLHYTTTLRAYFMKSPRYWEFCVRTTDGLFDGPGNLSTNIVSVKLENLYYQNMNTQVSPGNNGELSWSILDDVRLSTSDGTLAHCDIKPEKITLNSPYNAPYSLFFVVRFKILVTDDVQIDERTAGYYASQALFYMKSYYP